VLNGDIITNINLKKMMVKPNSIAAIELRTNYGTMKIKNNKILQFNEKTDVKDIWMNGGIYHLNTNIAKILPRRGSIEGIVFPKLAKKKSLLEHIFGGFYSTFDHGCPEILQSSFDGL